MKRALHKAPEIVIQTPEIYEPIQSESEVDDDYSEEDEREILDHEDNIGQYSFNGVGYKPFFPLKYPDISPKIKFLTPVEEDHWAKELVNDYIHLEYGTPDDEVDIHMNRKSRSPRSIWDKIMIKWYRWRYADYLNFRIQGPVYGPHRGDNIGPLTCTGTVYT